jgi:signal peptidase I
VRRGVRFGVVLVMLVAAVTVLRVFIVSPYYIPSESMEPTLHGCTGCDNDRVLVNKISYDLHSIHVGDIVVFDRPKSAVDVKDKVLIKRVVAVGGDQVAISDGHVYVNDKKQSESYLKPTKACPTQTTSPKPGGPTSWTIPRHDIFVLGDNRCDSVDSRYFGPVPDSLVVGRAFAIIWPLSRVRLL